MYLGNLCINKMSLFLLEIWHYGCGADDVSFNREYPGKEVKRGLEQLYRKVEKHLSEEGNLLQASEIIFNRLKSQYFD